jgi:hypothetical protein
MQTPSAELPILNMLHRVLQILTFAAVVAGCAGTEFQSPAPSRADVAQVKEQINAESPDRQPMSHLEAQAAAASIFEALAVDAGKLCRTLAEAENCDRPYFLVEDSARFNAFTDYEVDGRPSITLTRALVEQFADQPDELALVIGHQYAHLITGQIQPNPAGDNLAADLLNSTMSILSAAGSAGSSNRGPYGRAQSGPVYSRTEIDDYLNSDIHHEAFDSFTKAQEREADYLATYLAARNNYQPTGSVLIEIGAMKQRDPLSLYDKLDQEVPFSYWDTHTYSADRAARIQVTLEEIEWLKSKGYVRPIPPKLILEITDNNDSIHSLEDLVYPAQ